MRRISVSVGMVAIMFAVVAMAELSEKYRDWPDGAAGLLLTKEERKEFKVLTSDAAAEAFVELFWAKRDPDLNTAVNEFKVDFDLRAEAADQQFGFANVAGSHSDRGRTLILMGPPNQRQNFPAGAISEGEQNVEGGEAFQDRGATEVWEYKPDRLPEGVKATSVLFIFRESRVGYGDYMLDRSDRRNAQGQKLLADAPKLALLHKDLKEVPRVGFLAGSKAAGAADLAVFDAEPRPWPEGAVAQTAEGVVSEALHPLWLWIQLPAAEPAATRAVGRIVNAAGGEIVGTFDAAVEALQVGDERAYQFSFPVEAGSWKIDLALLGDAGPVAVRSIEATTSAVPAEGTYLSQFYWGADVRQESKAKFGDPFNVGGWHVIPRTSNAYTTKESVAYFCYILRPALDETQTGKYELKLALFMGDRKLTETPPQPVQISQVSGDLWMFGHGLPLQSFKKGGDFKLVVTLTDTLSQATRSVDVPMKVTRLDASGNPVVEAPPQQ